MAPSGPARAKTAATPPPITPEYLLHLLAAISRHRDTALDHALAEIGMSAGRYRALNAIAAFEPCTMGELAQTIGVDRTTMTRTVDHLVEASLVERLASSTDRRQVLLRTTEQGQRAVDLGGPIVIALNRKVLNGVSVTAQRAIIEAERRMFANLVDEPRAVERMLGFSRGDAGE